MGLLLPHHVHFFVGNVGSAIVIVFYCPGVHLFPIECNQSWTKFHGCF